MKYWWTVLLLAGACQQQPRATVKPAEITFDGAEVTDAAAARTHGERLSRVLGCRGCHGEDLRGQNWDKDPKGYGILWASNLTRAIPAMADAQLRDVLTKGVHPRRRDLWLMPSQMFQHLSSADLDALITYLRSVTPAGEATPDPRPGPRALRQIRSGEVKPAAALVRERRDMLSFDAGPPYGLGRYITEVTCVECHGTRLEGSHDEEGSTPDLVVAGGYSRAEFETLLTKGIPAGGRKFKNPLMGEVARSRFSHLTPHERDALYDYLKARAERSQ
jgi:mono/diheme cytochrome c family protein